MVFSFARVKAVVGMDVEDYCQQGKRFWLRLHKKGGKRPEVPAHRKAEGCLDAYVQAGRIGVQQGPHFSGSGQKRCPDRAADPPEEGGASDDQAADRRPQHRGMLPHPSRHLHHDPPAQWRYAGEGQQIAAYGSPPTKLYDRTSDQVGLDEIEKILI